MNLYGFHWHQLGRDFWSLRIEDVDLRLAYITSKVNQTATHIYSSPQLRSRQVHYGLSVYKENGDVSAVAEVTHARVEDPVENAKREHEIFCTLLGSL